MKTVHLVDQQGILKKKYVGFSFLFFFFGPIYLFANIKIITGILYFMILYYLLPIPGMNIIANFFASFTPKAISEQIINQFMFFRNGIMIYVGVGLFLFIHIFLSFFMEGFLLRRSIRKKKYLPVTEDDARLLISIHACNRKIQLAYPNKKYNSTEGLEMLSQIQKDVPYIINADSSENKIKDFKQKEKERKINELNDLYKFGQMTREEYEMRRAHIVNSYK